MIKHIPAGLIGLFLVTVSLAQAGPKAVFLIGEREYETKTTLPAFASAELTPRGYECVFVHAEGDEGDARNVFPGIEAIDEADILVVSTRRRTLPTEDLARVRRHIAAGKPVVTIRTACHGFALRNGEPEEGFDVWQSFDVDVMGGRYDGHLKNEVTLYKPTDAKHPVLNGVSAGTIESSGTLYRVYDLNPDATLLLEGSATVDGETSTFPAAWVRTTDSGSRVLGAVIGHKSDFQSGAIRQLLVNAFAWCLDDQALAAAPTGAALANQYGFAPTEVYELDWRTRGLQAADLNNDGRLDVAAIDNRRSRIAVFQQRPDGKRESSPERINSLVDPGRFDQRSILVDRSVSALAIGDVNGDGRADVVTLESPERLVVRLQTDDGFEESQTIRVPDAGTDLYDMSAADLDADGDADVVILGERTTTLFESRGTDGLVARKPRLNTSNDLNMLQLVDVDGDGRIDWFYSAVDPAGSFLCLRRQLDEPLAFGPEIRLTEDEYRAITIGQADGQPGSEFFAVDTQTGRVEMLGYATDDADSEAVLSDRVTQYGLSGGRQDRVAATGDFDGDGRDDLVVSNPAAAELILFLQSDAGLTTASLCPSLLGVTSLHASDFNADGRDELLMLSDKEMSIGVASWDVEAGRFAFPQIIPMNEDAEPCAVTVPDAVAKDQRGFVAIRKGDKSKTVLATWVFKDGAWSEVRSTEVEGTKLTFESGLRTIDADGDDRTDFLAIPKRDKPRLFLSDNDGELTPHTGGLSLPRVAPAAISVSSDGRSVLIAQSKFVRRMTFDDTSFWQVAEQFNAPNSEVDFESAIEFRTADGKAVAAYDDDGGRIMIYLPGSDAPQQIDVGKFQLQQLIAADFDGDQRDDVILIGADRVGVIRSGGAGPSLKTRLTYESDDEKAYFADVLVGDINADGRADLLINETRQHTIAVVALQDAATQASQAVRFKLFEEKRFSSSREQPGLQPRELVLADVTGDGRDDLIMLCHDRLLLLPQDAPAE